MNIPSSTTLDELLRPPIMSNVNQMSPADLAFIGDVLYEMFIRCRHVWPPRKTADMQVQVVSLVRGMWIILSIRAQTRAICQSRATCIVPGILCIYFILNFWQQVELTLPFFRVSSRASLLKKNLNK